MRIYTSDTRKYEIHDLEDWFKFCPPEGKEKQWVDYRSAKEMARFWLNKDNHENFKRFICRKIDAFEFDYIVPEYLSKFDSFGKPRQHDLLISEKNNQTIITVEGRADEPFGNLTFGENFKNTIDEKLLNGDSKALDRMINLYQHYFKDNSAVLSIMYPLAYWFAGSLIDAIKFDTENIIMVLQEFRSGATTAEKLQNNHVEFDKFIEFISEGEYKTTPDKNIVGPIENQYTENKKLYIGFFSVDLK
jgi:hypothetical protein